MKRFFALTLTLCALLLFAGLAACGDDDDDSDAGDGDTTPTETTAGDGDNATDAPDDGDDDGGEDNGDDGDDDDDGGDDGDPGASLEDYFQTVEEIGVRTNDELEAISDELLGGTYTTAQEEIDAVRDAFQRSGQVIEEAVLDLAQLEPPPSEAEAEHETFQNALVDVLMVYEDFLSESEGITTSAELESLINQYDPELTATDDAFDVACFDLQSVANDEGISVDIQCGDD